MFACISFESSMVDAKLKDDRSFRHLGSTVLLGQRACTINDSNLKYFW